jgi:hypothetical protein
MALYQLTGLDTILRTSDGAYIPIHAENRDYAAYLQWLADGNTPDPAPGPSPAAAVTDSAKSLLLQQAKDAMARGDTTAALTLLLQHLGG